MVDETKATPLDTVLKSARISTRAVSETLGVSPESVRLWRNGKKRPGPRSAAALERHYRIPLWVSRPDIWEPPEEGPRRGDGANDDPGPARSGFVALSA